MIKIVKNKEKLQKEAWERHQNLFEKEKEKMRKKAQHRYKNLFEEEKEKNHQYHHVQNKIFLKKKNKRKLSI